MTEKRFKSVIDEDTMSIMPYLVSDNEEECFYNLEGCVDLLNEQKSEIIELQERIIDLKDDKNQLHKVISKLRQEVAELKTRNSVLSSKLNQIPKSIKEVWLDE